MIPLLDAVYFVFFSDLNDLAWDQGFNLLQQTFRNFRVRAENQQIDMLGLHQIDDFILEVCVPHIMRQQNIVFAGVVDQILQGFMKPGVLPPFGLGRRSLLKNYDLGIESVRQGQGVVDAFQIMSASPDGN
jgi:hypothetical protein